ncbi:MAG TPA: TonB-dependent receptor [Woeseiaceae bacterium]|nr:TonB-dependent receptor [Woeseiaceae bacterium]
MAAVAILATAASAAEEQTLDEVATTDRAIPEILVKGTRTLNTDIVRTINDAQPYTLMSNESIRQSGAISVEDFLNRRLTMNAASQANSQQIDNQMGNISSINLRGLGPSQTLILVNGRRLSPFYFFGTTYQPDVNNIPAAAIERIEVLPSSSAGIYGGSAVGGVVNIVLKHDYEGAEIRLAYDNTFSGSMPIRTIDATYGVGLENGRTYLMVAAHYSDSDPLLVQDRLDLVERGINQMNRNLPSYYSDPGAPPFWGASTNIAAADGGPLQLNPLYGGQSLGSAITHVPVGTSAGTPPGELGANLLANAGSYNLQLGRVAGSFMGSGLLGQMTGAPSSKSALVTLHRDMTDSLEVFLEYAYSENLSETNEAIFPFAQFVPAGAPDNPFVNDVFVGYPDHHAGILSTSLTSNRATVGATLDLGGDWVMEGDYTWNANEFRYQGNTYDYGPAIDNAFASGAVNPFLDTLAYPQDLDPYVGAYASYFPSQLDNVALRFSGPLWSLPAGLMTMTVGLEHRELSVDDGFGENTFPSFPADNLYFTYLPQSQKTDSVYVEMNVPIISEDNALPGVRLFDMQLAGRSEHYSVEAGTINTTPGSGDPIRDTIKYNSNNFTLGFRYKPVDDLMLRASFGTAFLPPDYSAFQPPLLGGGTPNVTNPVIDHRRGDTTQAVQFIVGGNPDIKPLTSEDWNFGFVYEPQFLPDLRVNVQWYRLTEKNVPITPSLQQIVDAEAQFPDRVARDEPVPGDPYGVGVITVVDASLLNGAKLETEGFDFLIDYRWDTASGGTFSWSAAATLITEFKRQTSLNGPFEEIANQVAAGGPLELRGNTTFMWQNDDWNLGWTINYYGAYDQYDLNGVDLYVQAQGADRVPSQIYHTAFASYSFPSSREGVFSGVSVQAGIKNVFDKLPPYDAYYSNNGFYSPFGDARLRSFWLSASKSF